MRYIVGIILFLFLFSSCGVETKRLEHFSVHGIDVSHYQSKIDWDEVVKEDVAFSFIKATEGIELQDSTFGYNWTEIKRVGMKRGAYHFFRPSVSAHTQARNFISQVDLSSGDLPPVLDIEVIDGVSTKLMINRMKIWLEIIENHYNIRPIIYTNLNFYNKHIAGNFKSYPIWIARYNYEAPSLKCGTDWDFWQYGNRGKLAGIKGDVDFNVFRGTYKELSEMTVPDDTALSDLVIDDYSLYSASFFTPDIPNSKGWVYDLEKK